MKKSHLVALLLAQTVVACGGAPVSDELQIEGAARVAPPTAAAPESTPNPLDMAVEGDAQEMLAALKADEPVFGVLRDGVEVKGTVLRPGENAVARVVSQKDPNTLVVELALGGVETQAEVAVADVKYLKQIDLALLGAEIERAMGTAAGEIDDFDIDEAARRSDPTMSSFSGALPQKDFDCIARFARISASRDFIPFPLTNCAAPQEPVGDPERIADAVQARKVSQNIYNQMVTAYNNAQAMIAALQARLGAIQNAYVFIRHHPHFKEYNVTHFKKFVHGRKSYNDRYKRAEALLIAAALATQAQIAAYAQVPPPNPAEARSQANYIVAKKWNCVLQQGLLNNGGRSGSTIVGVSVESLGAPFVDIQVMLDDHPPLPQTAGWGGLFDVSAGAGLPADVTRLPVANFVPVRATAGLPIVMFRFQPLDAKKTRPVGRACTLRAGIVL